MNLPSLSEFESDARARGFDQVLERRWAPETVIATHTHDFDVDALVTDGELWLSHGGRTLHLRAGDRFTLARGVEHDERYGPQGAAYFVARRHGG